MFRSVNPSCFRQTSKDFITARCQKCYNGRLPCSAVVNGKAQTRFLGDLRRQHCILGKTEGKMRLPISREEIECRVSYAKIAPTSALRHGKADLLFHQNFFRNVILDIAIPSVANPKVKRKQNTDKKACPESARECYRNLTRKKYH